MSVPEHDGASPNEGRRQVMSSTRVLSVGVAAGLFLAVLGAACTLPAHAAWVNSAGTQFQVGGQLRQIVPTNAGTTFADPTCGAQGGTSLALVPTLLQG